MNNDVQEIKSRLNVVDVIHDYIGVKKMGTNFKSVCPFHNEKTPSFVISPEKQIWHCFGCGEGGDIFSFVEKIENIEFSEALRMLAQKAGVELSNVNPQKRDQRNKMIAILDATNKFFVHHLQKSPKAGIARDYLEERNINTNAIQDFQIGYAPESWSELLDYLVKREFFIEDIAEVGMVIKKDGGNTFYDRFRNRLMFPIRNVTGDVIGFGGRILDSKQKGGKYINSPQSLVYNKSEVIYGLYEAKKAIKNESYAIVVEGYLDVIANHQAGIKNVIASSGTAFSSQQVILIKRYTKTLLFCFDADAAGQQALLRGVDVALKEGMNIKVITIPLGYGKDPDECINKDVSVWKQAILDAEDLMTYFIKGKLKNLKSPAEKSEAITELLDIISKFEDKVQQSYWLKDLAHKFDIEVSILQEKLGSFNVTLNNTKLRPVKVDMARRPQENPQTMVYKRLFALLFSQPLMVYKKVFALDEDLIKHEFFLELYKQLQIYYNINNSSLPLTSEESFAYEGFLEFFNTDQDKEKLKNAFDRLYLYGQKEFCDYLEKDIIKELNFLIKRMQSEYARQRIHFLTKELDNEKNPEKIKLLTDEFNRLIIHYKD